MSFVISQSGSLVYVPGPVSSGQQDLAVFDRKGGVEALNLPDGRYDSPRVSPDGTRIVFETNHGKEAVVSIYELSRASSVRRLTFGGNNRFPIWSADGHRVTFQSDREGAPAVFWQRADGGTAERLTTPEPGTSHTPESWSPDGEVLLFSETKNFVSSLWTFTVKDRKATPFGDVNGSALPTDAMFSPDGRWIAYQTGEVGMGEGVTYVQPFPPTGAKYQIAPGGRPLWSRDGKELFFVPAPGRFMAVTINASPTFTFTNPVSVPRGFGAAIPGSPRTFDTMADGRFVGVVPRQSQLGSGPAQIRVVLNWTEELKRLVPTRPPLLPPD
jgi:Tol biopolymer transport system component